MFYIAVESESAKLVVSVLADGMMLTMTADASNRNGTIYLDRVTSARVHLVCLLGLLV